MQPAHSWRAMSRLLRKVPDPYTRRASGTRPAQHGQLVAEHEDLRVLGLGIHPMGANDLNDAPDETVEQGQDQERQVSPSVSWLVKLGQGVLDPSRFARTLPKQIPASLDELSLGVFDGFRSFRELLWAADRGPRRVYRGHGAKRRAQAWAIAFGRTRRTMAPPSGRLTAVAVPP